MRYYHFIIFLQKIGYFSIRNISIILFDDVRYYTVRYELVISTLRSILIVKRTYYYTSFVVVGS